MAACAFMKPFSPEETQRILHHLPQPAVFLNMTQGWRVLHWSVEHLATCTGDKFILFRLGRRDKSRGPQFETNCSYVEAKLVHFLNWSCSHPESDLGPFLDFPHSEYWAYADYKYIALLFQEKPNMFEDVKWSDFGFHGRNGRESTLWIGTEGANTPCHQDSYGFNLVLQVQGRKRWHLFAPEDTTHLYPTRIPYEESSTFSKVDVLHPDLKRFPEFKKATAYTVTLQPGQVLYVPRHWWHYVESVDPITVSVNSWVEMEADDKMRVCEALTRAVVCAFKTTPSTDNCDNWLNPTEERVTSHNENMQHVNLAVRAYKQKQGSQDKETRDLIEQQLVKKDSRGQDKSMIDELRSFVVPFGPHLVPVCHKNYPPEARGDPSPCTSKKTQQIEAVCLDKFDSEAHTCIASYQCSTSQPDKEMLAGDWAPVTTNELLDCLVHPDIISCITERLLRSNTSHFQ